MITSSYGAGRTTNLLASAVSGFCCAFTTLPPDTIKTRMMQVRRG
jgi:solute carrier family 25 oxoglutarate transporter 11